MKRLIFCLCFLSISIYAQNTEQEYKYCGLNKTAQMIEENQEHYTNGISLLSPNFDNIRYDYYGCQTLWFTQKNSPEKQWKLKKIVEFKLHNSEIIEIKGFDSKNQDEILSCSYSNRVLTKGSPNCLKTIKVCDHLHCKYKIEEKSIQPIIDILFNPLHGLKVQNDV